MTLPSGTQLGPYEIVEHLGAGGMGEVYRARDPRLSREVAIKLISTDGVPPPDRLRRFETEARAAAQLAHPNVVTVFDVGTHEGHPYLVLELFDGETLRETLHGGVPPLRQAVAWALEISRGLAAAHDRGIVHRDLKPDNVFLTTEGRLKILDFGLAKLHEPLVSDEADRESPTATKDTSPGVLLGTVGYMAPEQVKGQTPDPRTDVFALGAVLYEMVSGRRAFTGETAPEVLAAILRDEPPALESLHHGVPASVETVARRCLAKRPADRFSSARAVEAALETVLSTLEPTRVSVSRAAEVRGPYPGLSAFTEADAERFFGREAEVEALWEKLRRGRPLAVIGPSGAGKTSFVRAGLVPAKPSGWGAMVATPGGAPMRALAQALVEELPSDADTMKQLLGFDDPDVAFAMVKKWRETHLEAVLVLDQFEELFTLNPPEVQERFAGLLGRLAREADVHVLISMRDDFLMRCHEQEALVEVFEHLTPLGPLSGEGTRRALEEPAKREGVSFEDETLVAEMLEAVEGARGALPLLAFAVARLWEKRDRDRKLLTRRAYEEIGGVAGALAQHAEQTLERIGSQREPIVREIFRNLVTAQWTRAVADRDQLLSALPDPVVGAQVLDSLVEARLLTSYEAEGPKPSSRGASSGSASLPSSRGAPSGAGDEGSAAPSGRVHRIEIVHESLLRAWPRLVRWQAQDEEGAVLRDQLKQAAGLWEEKGRPDDLLWTGTSEREFELWRDRYPGQLTALEEEYSQAMVDRTRRRRRRRRAAVVSLVLGLAAVAVAIGISRQQAVEQARRAEAAQLLTLAEARLEDDPTEALAYATRSLEVADTEAGRLAVLKALSEAPPARELVTGGILARVPAFSPNGRWLAAAGHGGEAGVWTDDGTGPLRLGGLTPTPNCPNTALWPSDSLLVTGLDCGLGDRVFVWTLPEGAKLRTIEFGRPSGWSVGREQLFAETADATGHALSLRSWRLPNGEPETLGLVDTEGLGVTADASESGVGVFEPIGRGWLFVRGREIVRQTLPIDRSPGGRVSRSRHTADVVTLRPGRRASDPAFSMDQSGQILVYPANSEDEPAVLGNVASMPDGAWPGASGRWIVGPLWEENEARVWDTTAPSGARPLRLRRSSSWYMAEQDVHQKGDWLVATTDNWTRLTFWPLRPPRPHVIDGYKNVSRPVAFSSDGRWLASHWPDGALRLWPVPGTGTRDIRHLPLPEGLDAIDSLVFSPDDRFIVASGSAGVVCVLPLDGGPPRRLEGFSEEMVVTAALSPSGRRVAAAAFFGPGRKAMRVWNLDSGDVKVFDLPSPQTGSANDQGPSEVSGFESGVGALEFAGETTLYSAGDGGVRRWDLQTGRHETVIPVDWGVNLRMGMSPDGRMAVTQGFAFGRSEEWQAQRREQMRLRAWDLVAEEALPLVDVPQDLFGGWRIDASGRVVVGDLKGFIRVGTFGGPLPLHLLVGHEGPVQGIAISPDGRWIASTGQDNTLRLWPMPDLDRPPLHTLPHDELIAKLKSLTNLRAVRSSDSATGWTIELDTFPGWKDVPTW